MAQHANSEMSTTAVNGSEPITGQEEAALNWSTIIAGPEDHDEGAVCRAIVRSDKDRCIALAVDYMLGKRPLLPRFVLLVTQAEPLPFDVETELMDGVFQVDSRKEIPLTFRLEGRKGGMTLYAPLAIADPEEAVQRIVAGSRAVLTLHINIAAPATLSFPLPGAAAAVSRIRRHCEAHPADGNADTLAGLAEKVSTMTQRMISLSLVQIALGGALSRMDHYFEHTVSDMQRMAAAPECPEETRKRLLAFIELFKEKRREAGVMPLPETSGYLH